MEDDIKNNIKNVLSKKADAIEIMKLTPKFGK